MLIGNLIFPYPLRCPNSRILLDLSATKYGPGSAERGAGFSGATPATLINPGHTTRDAPSVEQPEQVGYRHHDAEDDGEGEEAQPAPFQHAGRALSPTCYLLGLSTTVPSA